VKYLKLFLVCRFLCFHFILRDCSILESIVALCFEMPVLHNYSLSFPLGGRHYPLWRSLGNLGFDYFMFNESITRV
jgi:hypothetical protein